MRQKEMVRYQCLSSLQYKIKNKNKIQVKMAYVQFLLHCYIDTDAEVINKIIKKSYLLFFHKK